MRKTKSSVKDIQKRREVLLGILMEYKKKGLEPSREQLLKKLSNKGYKIDLSTLYRDRCETCKENSFVKDLTILSTYSAYVEEMWDDLQIIRRWCLEKLRYEWDSKNIITMCQISKLLHENVKMKNDFFNGNTFNLAAALAVKKVENLEYECQVLKNKNQFLEANSLKN